MNAPARVLFDGAISDESKSGLVDTWERAVHLILQLQTQIRMVKWTMPEQSSKFPMVGKLFDAAYMDIHCTQTFAKRDGVPISTVLSPALIMVGNEDG